MWQVHLEEDVVKRARATLRALQANYNPLLSLEKWGSSFFSGCWRRPGNLPERSSGELPKPRRILRPLSPRRCLRGQEFVAVRLFLVAAVEDMTRLKAAIIAAEKSFQEKAVPGAMAGGSFLSDCVKGSGAVLHLGSLGMGCQLFSGSRDVRG